MTFLFASMSPTELMLLALALPLFATVGNFVFRDMPNLRDGMTLAFAITTCAVVITIYQRFDAGETFAFTAFAFQPQISISFEIEPLGMVFALVASSLWIVTHIYGIGYMRGAGEQKQARFFACFSFAIFATLGIAFSANLATLFVFYELLTVSTYPLVAHKENEASKLGARTYLAILMATSIVFLLTAVIWTYVVAGRLDFVAGGIIGPELGTLLPILLALYAFGIGKAALMPFHRWLPAAMVAPTPVSALLHAVAVVKAGVFTMLKVGVYVFGIDNLAATGASVWLMWVAAFSILAASVIALQQDNLKRRLAYSTVSQLSYITLGMALGHIIRRTRRWVAYRHPCGRQDHAVHVCRRDLRGDAQDGYFRHARAGAGHAYHLHRVRYRVTVHHRPTTACRVMVKMAVDAGRSRCRAMGAHRRADGLVTAQCCLSGAGVCPWILHTRSGGPLRRHPTTELCRSAFALRRAGSFHRQCMRRAVLLCRCHHGVSRTYCRHHSAHHSWR